jgi:hypothetical protein
VELTAVPIITSPTIAITSVIAATAEPGYPFLVSPELPAGTLFAPREDHDQSAVGGMLISGTPSPLSSLDQSGPPAPQGFPEANPGDFGQTSASSDEADVTLTDAFFDYLGQGDADALAELASW